MLNYFIVGAPRAIYFQFANFILLRPPRSSANPDVSSFFYTFRFNKIRAIRRSGYFYNK